MENTFDEPTRLYYDIQQSDNFHEK